MTLIQRHNFYFENNYSYLACIINEEELINDVDTHVYQFQTFTNKINCVGYSSLEKVPLLDSFVELVLE